MNEADDRFASTCPKDRWLELYGSCSSHKGADVAKDSCEGGAPTKVRLDHSVFTKCSPRYESLRLDADIARNPQQAGELGSSLAPAIVTLASLRSSRHRMSTFGEPQCPSSCCRRRTYRRHIDHTILLGSERPRAGIDLHTSVLTSGRPSRLVCTILKLPFRIVR